jgi:hypothetical protein
MIIKEIEVRNKKWLSYIKNIVYKNIIHLSVIYYHENKIYIMYERMDIFLIEIQLSSTE